MPRPFRHLSLTLKTPLVLGGLLALVIVALAAEEYRQVRAILLDHEASRLRGVAVLVARIAAQSLEQGSAEWGDVAADPALRGAAAGGDVAPAARVLAAALRESERGLSIRLLNAAGRCVAEAARPDPGQATSVVAGTCAPEPEAEGAPPVPGPSRMVRGPRGGLRYAFTAPVPGDGDTGQVGWITVAFRVSTDDGTVLLAGLVAEDASLVLANQDLSEGTPGVEALQGGEALPPDSVFHFVAGERERLGAAAPIVGSPWGVWVHRDLDSILAPARRALRAAILPSVLILGLGFLVAWLASRRLTVPLRELTDAAEVMSRGDLQRRVTVDRSDELGRLAVAFNAMAHAVGEARERLEHRVEERTAELSAALDELHETQEQLVARERLATLGQLAGGVGHELRNPLGVMTNALYYLETVLDDPPPKVREYLGILSTQVELARKIVGDLLDYARAKPPARELVSVDALLDDILADVQAPAGVQLIRQVAQGLPEVCVDRKSVV